MKVDTTDGEDLWKPPGNPLGPVVGMNIDDRAAYAKMRKKIHTFWQVDVLDAMPLELRKKTPFSNELLHEMATLAGITRTNMPQAHELLQLQVKTRKDKQVLNTTENSWVVTRRRHRSHGRVHEQTVHENVHGLMLDDVKTAMCVIDKIRANIVSSSGEPPAQSKKARKKTKNGRKKRAVAAAVEALRSGDGELSTSLAAAKARREKIQEKKDARGVQQGLDQVGDLTMASGNESTSRLKRQFRLQARMEKRKSKALPSEQLQMGSLPMRSEIQMETDRLVASLGTLSHATTDPHAYQMRASAMEMDDDDESDDDDNEEEEMD